MRLIVAGSRGFDDYKLLEQVLDEYVKAKQPQPESITVISGTARGADQLGERWAKSRGYLVTQVRAQWGFFGRAAGPIRNEQMARMATDCVLFWDGKSPGTQSMLHLATQYKLNPVLIVSKPAK